MDYSNKAFIDVIADEVASVLRPRRASIITSSRDARPHPRIPLGISSRHIHLTLKTFQLLFGENTEFESLRPLYQPGEFASRHLLTIVGPKQRCIQNVRVLGPFRKYDQVEVSLTDAIFLGIEAPVTNSGSLQHAAPLTLAGPHRSIHLENCAIIANRHIHMSNQEAALFGLKNGDYCKVRINGDKVPSMKTCSSEQTSTGSCKFIWIRMMLMRQMLVKEP